MSRKWKQLHCSAFSEVAILGSEVSTPRRSHLSEASSRSINIEATRANNPSSITYCPVCPSWDLEAEDMTVYPFKTIDMGGVEQSHHQELIGPSVLFLVTTVTHGRRRRLQKTRKSVSVTVLRSGDNDKRGGSSGLTDYNYEERMLSQHWDCHRRSPPPYFVKEMYKPKQEWEADWISLSNSWEHYVDSGFHQLRGKKPWLILRGCVSPHTHAFWETTYTHRRSHTKASLAASVDSRNRLSKAYSSSPWRYEKVTMKFKI